MAQKHTKQEKVDGWDFLEAYRILEWDVLDAVRRGRALPDDWHDIATTPDPGKTRVTIRLDADVVKFFRAMGPGWQTKANLVLRAWVKGRLARIVKGPDTTDVFREAEELTPFRPKMGDLGREVDRALGRDKK
jgi:hypothetical protein